MLNHVTVMGRLVRDPELRRTGSGTAVASFTLAVDRDFKDQNGERGTDFLDCVAWRNTAEFICKYFSKGRMVVASGRLQKRDYENQNGEKRYVTEIVVENAYFGDSKRDDGGNTQPGSYGNYGGYNRPSTPATTSYGQAPTYAQTQFEEITDDDGDLPF